VLRLKTRMSYIGATEKSENEREEFRNIPFIVGTGAKDLTKRERGRALHCPILSSWNPPESLWIFGVYVESMWIFL
jgi:hypothetical protein